VLKIVLTQGIVQGLALGMVDDVEDFDMGQNGG
jgi:hypothetical protein